LPLSNALGRAAALALPLVSGVVPHFGESPEDVLHTLFDVAPTVWLTLPGHLGRLASQTLEGLAATSPVKARAFAWAAAAGRRSLAGPGSLPRGGLYRALRWLVLRPLLNKLGFDRLELVVSRGDPLSPEAAALWQVCGLPVVNA
ncbi:MAG: long-chain fatty acid--CoA ligase, partial [Deltaproteobacteria bacterium]|nr:long-chain fatty acid--CoA ligase [Deltaproteobacteria bacterium]